MQGLRRLAVHGECDRGVFNSRIEHLLHNLGKEPNTVEIQCPAQPQLMFFVMNAGKIVSNKHTHKRKKLAPGTAYPLLD